MGEGAKQWNSTLTRKTPLRARKPIWACSKPPRDRPAPAIPKKKTALRKTSKKRGRQMTEYAKVRREFLSRPENQSCFICLRLGEPARPATIVHHYAGRIGRLLCYAPYFIASCKHHEEWPHCNGTKAREIGVLAPATEYNVFPVSLR